MEEIIRRLRSRSPSSMMALKESLPMKGLVEADEDDEDIVDTPEEEAEEMPDDLPPEEEDISDEGDDSGAPPTGSADDIEDEDTLTPDEDLSAEDEEEENKYSNPLDNPYAVNFKIGQAVALTYANGTKSKLAGTIDGYDTEGFYRIKWAHGKTTNGITDIALADLVQDSMEENKCVCGSKTFVTENNKLVCDRCGRFINESVDPLTKADKARPKGKKLIRSEAHPVSTAMTESTTDSGYAVLYKYDGDELSDYQSTIVVIASSAAEAIKKAKAHVSVGRHFEIDTTVGKKGYIPSVSAWRAVHPRSNYEILECDTPKKSIGDSIRKAFKSKKLKEDVDSPYFEYLKMKLEGEFWTRPSEIRADIEELGYEVDDLNSEYVVVYGEDEDGEGHTIQIPIGGTARTMTLDFRRARED